jgi:hypothetical protein
MIYHIKRLFRNLKRMYQLVPIVWNSYDFTYHSSLEFFKFQLNNIAENLESENSVTLSAKHNASRIRLVIKLIDRYYLDEYYIDKFYDELEKKYGKVDFEFIPTDESKEWFEMIEVFENDLTEEEKKQYFIDKENMFKKVLEEEKKAKKLIWKLIEHNIQSWWD